MNQTTVFERSRKADVLIVERLRRVPVANISDVMWRLSAAEHPMAAHQIDSRAIYRRSRSGDAKEGISSFLEKRAPVYPDKVSADMPDFFPWWDEPAYK